MRDPLQERCARERSWWCGCYDVGSEGELGVDTGLLVVGRGEDAEVDAEGEQQPEDEQPAIDRGAAAAGACEQEAAGRRRASTCKPAGKPRDRAAAKTDQEEGRAKPKERGPEEHADRERDKEAAGAGARRGAGEMESGERESGAERPGDESEGEAFECRVSVEVTTACAARPHEGEVAAVARGCSEGSEVGKPERDQ